MATTVPGQVSSNVVGSTFQAMTPTAQARQYELEDRKEAERRANNAKILADRAARQQAVQDEEDRKKVHAAFNETYWPRLQEAYQSNAVMSAPANTPAGKARDLAIGHGFTTGGTIGQPGTDVIRDSGAINMLPKPSMTSAEIQNQLDNMWREQTDPYKRAANKMNMMRMFYGTQLMPSSGRSEGGGGGMLTPGAYETMQKGQGMG